MGRATLVALTGTVIGSLWGCNAVLGIEKATLANASDGGDPLTCANYCNVIMQNCTGRNQEYLSTDVCLKMCSYMPKGQFYPPASEPDQVDTLGCRLWHANTALTSMQPEVHCRHAGPLGSDLCGGPCAPFCTLDWRFCTDNNNINVYDGQVMGCEAVCLGDAGAGYAYDRDSGDLVDPNGIMIETGNTLNCRLWHLETAISIPDPRMGPQTHCPHTGQVSQTCQ